MSKADFSKKAFLYKTTNRLNGRFYIGVRTFKNNPSDDTYLGSGRAIKAAISKYGFHNFKREILLIASAKYCYEIEERLVTQSLVDSEICYNLAKGGWGGSRGKQALIKMKATKKAQYESLTDEQKEERKNWLNKIRPTDLSKPKGKDSPHWEGYWITPLGMFETCRDAAKANGIDNKTVRVRCRKDNNKAIVKSRKGSIPPNWKGKTWKELGWGFTHKEGRDEQ